MVGKKDFILFYHFTTHDLETTRKMQYGPVQSQKISKSHLKDMSFKNAELCCKLSNSNVNCDILVTVLLPLPKN